MKSCCRLRDLVKYFSVFIVLVLLGSSCATIVAPTGGEKDEIPPTVVSSSPRNRSVNFNGNRFSIEFSEYIQLKDIDKNMLVSPPLGKTPDFKIKGRSLIVKLKDTLRSNTTYNFYFGNSIVDLTESNPLKSFSYSFSTGSVIDSLSLAGQVTDAFTRLPMKDMMIMLYRNTADSVPYLERPVYVSRVGDDGKFLFNCLAGGKYRVVAIKDANNDYLYNPPGEAVAFADSLVEPFYIKINPADTGKLVLPAETPSIALNAFLEPDSIQRLQKALMTAPHLLSMMFRYPLQAPEFRPINIDSTAQWSIMEFSPKRDTVSFWLTATMPDTLKLKILERGQVIDTAEVSTMFKSKSSDKGKILHADTTLRLSLPFGRSGYLGWNKPCIIAFSDPLKEMNGELPRLYEIKKKDTLVPKMVFADSIHRRVLIQHAWKTDEEYKLLLPAGTFTSIYGQTIDTSRSSFKLLPKEEYGTLKVKISLQNIPHPVILQLLSEKGVVLVQQTITQPQTVDFGFFTPGKYSLKAIMDSNSNGKWDTGRLIWHIQPEKVLMYPKTFEIRGNWELEENWQL